MFMPCLVLHQDCKNFSVEMPTRLETFLRNLVP